MTVVNPEARMNRSIHTPLPGRSWRISRRRTLLRLSPLVLIGLALSAPAQVGGPYELRKPTMTAGGTTSLGNDQALSALAGQSEATVSAGGRFELHTGFYAPQGSDRLFNDSFE